MKKIISKNNEFIKTLKKQKVKNRFLLFLDNPKTINEALDLGLSLQYYLIDEDLYESIKLPADYPNIFDKIILVNESIIKEFSSAVTPQGVIAVFDFAPKKVEVPKSNFLVLDNVQDAGNVGTLLRSALGADFKDVFLIDCAKITGDKVVRSSMGAIFKLNIFEISKQTFVDFALKNKLNLVCADMDGESIIKTKLIKNIGVVLGNEGNGVSKEIKAICEKSISIPMKNNLESLNVGVAGSIMMFEIMLKGN